MKKMVDQMSEMNLHPKYEDLPSLFGPSERQYNVDQMLDLLSQMNMPFEHVAYTFYDFILSMYTHAASTLARDEREEDMVLAAIGRRANAIFDALESNHGGAEPFVMHLAALALATHNALVAAMTAVQDEPE